MLILSVFSIVLQEAVSFVPLASDLAFPPNLSLLCRQDCSVVCLSSNVGGTQKDNMSLSFGRLFFAWLSPRCLFDLSALLQLTDQLVQGSLFLTAEVKENCWWLLGRSFSSGLLLEFCSFFTSSQGCKPVQGEQHYAPAMWQKQLYRVSGTK